MNWSVVILLLATVTGCDGLSCITSEQHWKKVPFTGLDYGHFMQELKNLTISQSILDGPCRVEIALNYYDEVFTIAFTKELGDSKLQLGLVRFDTFVVPVYDDEFYIENYLEYACSKGGCEIDFIKDHLPWLLGTSYPTLADNAVPLITRGTDGSGKKFTQLIIEY